MAMDDLLLYGLVMGSAGCAAISAYPFVSKASTKTATKIQRYQQAKVKETAKALDEIFMDVQPKWLKIAHGVGPIVLGLAGYFSTANLYIALGLAGVGIVVPDVWVRQARATRKKKFQNQLVDALFILSSSLRAGLSLTQAFEQLAQEMAAPASQEFGLVVKAHRLGRTLEASLEGLNERMKSDELRLVTTAVLLARETGGDVTQVITQLITTIRERKKLAEKVSTLTVQGRFQAYIMSALPILFAFFVRSFNPNYFQQMLETEIGQFAMAIAAMLWIVGIILLQIMSRVDY